MNLGSSEENFVASFFFFISYKGRRSNMWIMVMVSNVLTAAVMVLVLAAVQSIKSKNAKAKEEKALTGVSAGISVQLYDACPGSQWRWECRPVDFATKGGIARIEVTDHVGSVRFMDVCLMAGNYLALHETGMVKLSKPRANASAVSDNTDFENPATITEAITVQADAPQMDIKPNDEESVIKWYNIVLIDTLTAVINDLNAKDEVCVHIGLDGKAYVDNGGGITVVYDFGEMPDISLWGHITDKLAEEGLFAEVQEENCIFISWA